ncbi:hypothetical protein LTS18_008794 [Coniosporium uncinatum]|uniref:Uncharacterized protein n=1 Tax=Coniosporium uncinatum TaxID=93489 RepID=A0ACC3D1F3_9PEZI|nr:hypothetical protein LTS18_008794 [Coniosporium uncinatum]
MGALGSLIPLIILFLFVAVGGYIGYQMYLYSLELSAKANKKLEKKHIAFTKDGMKVGVKELRDEDYADKTQKYGFPQLPFLCLAHYRTESEGAGSTG